jgi:hypothetical protein
LRVLAASPDELLQHETMLDKLAQENNNSAVWRAISSIQ